MGALILVCYASCCAVPCRVVGLQFGLQILWASEQLVKKAISDALPALPDRVEPAVTSIEGDRLVEVAHMQGAMGKAGCDRPHHIGVLGDQGLAVQRGRHGVEHQLELVEHPIMARAAHHIEPAVRQFFCKPIRGGGRNDGVVASLPQDRGHID